MLTYTHTVIFFPAVQSSTYLHTYGQESNHSPPVGSPYMPDNSSCTVVISHQYYKKRSGILEKLFPCNSAESAVPFFVLTKDLVLFVTVSVCMCANVCREVKTHARGLTLECIFVA